MLGKAIQKAIKEGLQKGEKELFRQTVEGEFTASGKSAKSFKIKATAKGGSLSAMRYWLTNVEDREDGGKGRRSGRFAPPDVILKWIKVKGIKPEDPKTTLKQLAFLINRRLKQKGNSIFSGDRSGIQIQPVFEMMGDAIEENIIYEGVTEVGETVAQGFNKLKK